LILRRSEADHLGYKLVDETINGSTFTGRLVLAGQPLNTYGQDIDELEISVEYQSESRE
jgi:hypothetical protein